MKKALPLLVLFIVVLLASCGYSKADITQAKAEAWQEGYEEGYDLAKYESSADLERIKSEYDYYMDSAYEAGYEAGYEDGYSDGLKGEDIEPYHGSGVIKKDRD